mgnify:CR=1 FL=1
MTDLIDNSDVVVLIVDNNPVNVGIEQAILRKAGYCTASASDGTACIEAARKLKPDLILLDIVMPKMNGIEACKVLRQDEETRDIPIIFVTGRTHAEALREAFESGGTDYVRKPVNRIELLARIKSVLSQRILTQKLLEEGRFKGVLEMAGAVCHELNQPMQAIIGHCQLLMMDVSEDQPLYQDLSEIKGQIDRMAKITKRLMGITRYKTCDYVGGGRIVDIDEASRTAK